MSWTLLYGSLHIPLSSNACSVCMCAPSGLSSLVVQISMSFVEILGQVCDLCASSPRGVRTRMLSLVFCSLAMTFLPPVPSGACTLRLSLCVHNCKSSSCVYGLSTGITAPSHLLLDFPKHPHLSTPPQPTTEYFTSPVSCIPYPCADLMYSNIDAGALFFLLLHQVITLPALTACRWTCFFLLVFTIFHLRVSSSPSHSLS